MELPRFFATRCSRRARVCQNGQLSTVSEVSVRGKRALVALIDIDPRFTLPQQRESQ